MDFGLYSLRKFIFGIILARLILLRAGHVTAGLNSARSNPELGFAVVVLKPRRSEVSPAVDGPQPSRLRGNVGGRGGEEVTCAMKVSGGEGWCEATGGTMAAGPSGDVDCVM